MTAMRFMKCYPAEGDSAVAELWAGDDVVADVWLSDIGLSEHGDARVERASVRVRFYTSPELAASADLDLNELQSVLEQAREWLMDNERGRVPLPE